jgi:hypothetical protein
MSCAHAGIRERQSAQEASQQHLLPGFDVISVKDCATKIGADKPDSLKGQRLSEDGR